MIFTHNNSCNNTDFLNMVEYCKLTHVPTSGILIFEFDVSLWSVVLNQVIVNIFFLRHFK